MGTFWQGGQTNTQAAWCEGAESTETSDSQRSTDDHRAEAVLQTGIGLRPQHATWAPAPRGSIEGGLHLVGWCRSPVKAVPVLMVKGESDGCPLHCSYNFSVGLKIFKLQVFCFVSFFFKRAS